MTNDYNQMMEHNYRRQQFENAVERNRLIREHRNTSRTGVNPTQWIVKLITAVRMPRVRIKLAPRRDQKTANFPS
ncbi:MAG: hypothetical protein AAFV33_21265 [Chloroflexota bacterium]